MRLPFPGGSHGRSASRKRQLRVFFRRTARFASSLPRPCVHGGPGRDHLPGPRVHRPDGAVDDAGPEADQAANGIRLQLIHDRLCAVRDADRSLGRPDRHQAAADANRRLVVVLHDRDGRGLQLCLAAGGAVPLRHGRGGGFSERVENVFTLVSSDRAGHGAGNLLRGRSPGRGPHAAAGNGPARLHAVEDGLRGLRSDWLCLGGRLVPLVSRRSRPSSRRDSRRVEADRGRASGRRLAPARSARPGPHPVAPEHDRALPDVFHTGIRVLLQHHLATNLPGEGAGSRRPSSGCWPVCR